MVRLTAANATEQLLLLANSTKDMAKGGKLDTGYQVGSLLLQGPVVPSDEPASPSVIGSPVLERQRIVIVGNAPAAPSPPLPPAKPVRALDLTFLDALSPQAPPLPALPPATPPPSPYLPPAPRAPPPTADAIANAPLGGKLLLEFNGEIEDDELFGQALLVLTQVVFAPKMRLEVVVVAVKLVLPQSAKRA